MVGGIYRAGQPRSNKKCNKPGVAVFDSQLVMQYGPGVFAVLPGVLLPRCLCIFFY